MEDRTHKGKNVSGIRGSHDVALQVCLGLKSCPDEIFNAKNGIISGKLE